MHYIAWRILEGAAPYRDLFDMNFPGVYAAHLLLLVTLGPGDLAFRAFDLGMLAAVCAGLACALRSSGAWGGLAAAAHHARRTQSRSSRCPASQGPPATW